MSRTSIEIPAEVSWSKAFDYYNGKDTTTTRTDKYTWSRKMVKGRFREDANQAIAEAKFRGQFTGEYGASWDVVSAKARVEYEVSADIKNTVNSVTRDEVKEEIFESGEEVTEYNIGPENRLIGYRMHFNGGGVSVASRQIITRPEPDPNFEKVLSSNITCALEAKRFLRGIQVVYGDKEWQRPDNCIPVDNNKSPDINKGFSYSNYVWLVPLWGIKASDSETCTSLSCRLSDDAETGSVDLAAGAGGKYRYLDIGRNPAIRYKITEVLMIRGDFGVSREDAWKWGWSGVSNDFNEGRKHDYIQLLWKSIKVDDTVLS
ncbi:hypothetical protein APSETT444_007313 [Aspergillus pseudonomiae]